MCWKWSIVQNLLLITCWQICSFDTIFFMCGLCKFGKKYMYFISMGDLILLYYLRNHDSRTFTLQQPLFWMRPNKQRTRHCTFPAVSKKKAELPSLYCSVKCYLHISLGSCISWLFMVAFWQSSRSSGAVWLLNESNDINGFVTHAGLIDTCWPSNKS